jgi:hypothetical protein
MGVSVISLVAGLWKQRDDNRENQRAALEREKAAQTAILERETAREHRMTDIETKVDLFWGVIEKNVGQLLKSPTHEHKDLLLYKLAHRELTLPEAELLRSILTDEMELRGRENGVIGFTLVLGRLEGLIYDLKKTENTQC